MLIAANVLIKETVKWSIDIYTKRIIDETKVLKRNPRDLKKAKTGFLVL